MELSWCPEPVNCSARDQSSYHLGLVPGYVGIPFRMASCLGSVAIVLIYLAWKDLRRKGAQSIVTYLAIADFFIAAAYLVDIVNVMIFHDEVNPSRCKVYNSICLVESYILTWSTMSSYLWTVVLAFYFYLVVVKDQHALANRLMPLYHIVSWGLPIAVVLPLLFLDKLTYSPFVTGLWCYSNVPAMFFQVPFLGYSSAIHVLVKLPEVTGYLVILVLYTTTVLFIYRQVGQVPQAQMQGVNKTNIILVSIPVVFIFLRVWCTAQYFLAARVAQVAHENDGCIPVDLKNRYVVLAVFQAIGSGGQGLANAVMYILLSKEMRKRLFWKPCKRKMRPTKKHHPNKACVRVINIERFKVMQ